MDYFRNPWWIIAMVIAVGFSPAGAGLLLHFIFHAFGGFAGPLVQAGALSTVLMYVTEASAIVVTGTLVVTVVKQVVQHAKKDPYAWILPMLAILSAII
jgi:hypothetical protein